MKKYLLFGTTLFTIFGCEQPEISNEELSLKLQSSNVVVKPIEKPVTLSEETKAHMIGNVIIGAVATVALGGGHPSSSTNPTQIQNDMKTISDFQINLTNSLPTSTLLKQGGGIDMEIASNLNTYLSQKQKKREK